jgi:hypothetical protein
MTTMSPRMRRRLREQVIAGTLPAEALPPADGDRIVTSMWQHGLSDVDIAYRTQWSTYTVARKRRRLGLVANSAQRREEVA